jgi:hypothetical protein
MRSEIKVLVAEITREGNLPAVSRKTRGQLKCKINFQDGGTTAVSSLSIITNERQNNCTKF